MPRFVVPAGGEGGGRLVTPAHWRKKFKCGACRAKNEIYIEDLRLGSIVRGTGITSLSVNCRSCGILQFFGPADIDPKIWAMVIAG
jgi:hypothetical protein